MREFERIFSREDSEDMLESDRIKCSHLRSSSYRLSSNLRLAWVYAHLASSNLACTIDRVAICLKCESCSNRIRKVRILTEILSWIL
jgi:hypothetical protein